MADYNSKYTGEQVEEMLDQIANGEIGGGGVTIETDPIFSASPAASITEAKKAEWDNKVDNVSGKGLSTEDFTSALKTKLEGLSNYDDTEIENAITSLQTQFNTLVSGNASDAINSFNEIVAFLDGVKDTEDLSSIIASIEQQIAGKMDKVTLATVATSGSYNDLSNKPTIPSEQVNADWNATSGKAQILNKPTIPSAVTESTVSGWGFTKNTGTYSKPSTGIPKSDLASAVQTSLGKADTALQSYTEQYKGTVTAVKINGSTKYPSNGVVDLGTISGDSSSGGSSSGSTTTDTYIELDPNATYLRITNNGTYILKCNSGQNYSIAVESSGAYRIIMGVIDGSPYGTISLYHSTGSIIWANNNEPVFEDGKMMEFSFESLMTGFGYYSVLGTWASYDAYFESENSGGYE